LTVSLPPPKSSGAGGANEGTLRWQTHLEMVHAQGDKIMARLAPVEAPPDFWPALAKAGEARFDLVVRTHCDPGTIRTLSDLASFIRARPQYEPPNRSGL